MLVTRLRGGGNVPSVEIPASTAVLDFSVLAQHWPGQKTDPASVTFSQVSQVRRIKESCFIGYTLKSIVIPQSVGFVGGSSQIRGLERSVLNPGWS
jgi:hypothetical protein